MLNSINPAVAFMAVILHITLSPSLSTLRFASSVLVRLFSEGRKEQQYLILRVISSIAAQKPHIFDWPEIFFVSPTDSYLIQNVKMEILAFIGSSSSEHGLKVMKEFEVTQRKREKKIWSIVQKIITVFIIFRYSKLCLFISSFFLLNIWK